MLDEQQRRAVLSTAKYMRVLASAGSGKTRVLTQRLAQQAASGVVEPSHALVLTFTRKAADELIDRLRALGTENVTAGTFHGVAFAQLRTRGTVPRIVSPTTVLDRLPTKFTQFASPRAIMSEISLAKSRGITPDTATTLRNRGVLAPAKFMSVYEAYEREKHKRGVIDFDDVLLLMTRSLESDSVFADAQRWKFRHLFVDEFQDLNAAQFRLMQLWCGEHASLTVVGDPNQAIYGWNGADARYLHRLGEFFPGLETVDLTKNYRSSSAILQVAQVVQPDIVAPPLDANMLPVVREYETDVHEAISVAHNIRDMHRDGERWADIAVLFRTNAQRGLFEDALRQLDIPVSGGSSWVQAEATKAALSYLSETAHDSLAVRSADLFSDVTLSAELPNEFRDAVRAYLAQKPDATIAQFRSWLDISTRFDGPATSHAVTLTTFHRAKGLEWPTVFLVGIEEGLVPLGTDSMLDEERRLFYVAITRAQHRLYFSWAKSRPRNVSHRRALSWSSEKDAPAQIPMQQRRPSPWLREIEALLAEMPREAAPGLNVSKVEAAKQILLDMNEAGESAQDINLFDALQNWRLGRASLVGIDPEIVLTDDEIYRIVRVKPKSAQDFIEEINIRPARAVGMVDELLKIVKEVGS